MANCKFVQNGQVTLVKYGDYTVGVITHKKGHYLAEVFQGFALAWPTEAEAKAFCEGVICGPAWGKP